MIPNIVKDKQPYKTEMHSIYNIYVEKCVYFATRTTKKCEFQYSFS